MSDTKTAYTAKIIVVNDLMQSDYRYELSEPMGENFNPEGKTVNDPG